MTSGSIAALRQFPTSGLLRQDDKEKNGDINSKREVEIEALKCFSEVFKEFFTNDAMYYKG